MDVSASMEGEKWESTRNSLERIVGHLTENDSFGVVTFGNIAMCYSPLQNMTKNAKEDALDAIDQIDLEALTLLSGGIEESIKQFQGQKNLKDTFCAVLLLTDGAANFGLTKYNYNEFLTSSVRKKSWIR